MASRQARKVASGAEQHLEPGEQVVAAMVAAARGHTQAMAGSLHVGTHQKGKANAAAREAGLVIASPMGVVLTQRRLLTLKIGAPIGLGIGGAVKDLLSAVPIAEIDGMEVKRLALGFKIMLRVRGSEITLEANAAAGAKDFAAALEAAHGEATG
jgi:hypothetical protein